MSYEVVCSSSPICVCSIREKRAYVGCGYSDYASLHQATPASVHFFDKKSIIQGGGIRSQYFWRFIAFLILVSLSPAGAQEELN